MRQQHRKTIAVEEIKRELLDPIAQAPPTAVTPPPQIDPVTEGKIKEFWQESHVRHVLQDMVNPLIKGQKLNQVEVNKVREEMREMKHIHTESMAQIGETAKQLEGLPDILLRLTNIENAIQNNQRVQKATNESLVDRCERNVQRSNELNREITRMDKEMGPRDTRILTNTEQIIAFKEKISLEVTAFMKQTTRDLDNFLMRSNKAQQDLVLMDNFFKTSKSVIDGFQQELSKVKYSSEQVNQRFTSFILDDSPLMLERLSKLELKTGTHDLSVNDIFNQFRLKQIEFNEALQRVEHLENFVDKSLPVQIHLQVSDYLQEFLSVPDRLKLIEFENQKIQELTLSQRRRNSQGQDQGNPFENQQLASISHKLSSKQVAETKCIKNLNEGFEKLLQSISLNNQGFGRFKLNQEIDVDEYIERADQNREHLEKEQQKIIECEQKLNEHRTAILKQMNLQNYKLEDFTLRSPDQLHDNPFMRFIGYNYPVKIYKEVVIIRERKVLKNARQLRKGQPRNQKKSELNSSAYSSSSNGEKEDIFTKLLKAHHLLDNTRINFNATDFIDKINETDSKDSQESNFNIYGDQQIPKVFQSSAEDILGGSPHARTKSLGREELKQNKTFIPVSTSVTKPNNKNLLIQGDSQVLTGAEQKQAPINSLPKKRALTKIIDKSQISKLQLDNPELFEGINDIAEIKGSEARQIAQILEGLFLPNEIKEAIVQTLKYVIKRTKVLNRRMTQLAQFMRDNTIAMSQSLQAAVERTKKEREAIEDQYDLLDSRYKKVFATYDSKIASHHKDLTNFTELMQNEYVAFFKNKQRIRSELLAQGTQLNERIDHYRKEMEANKTNIEIISSTIPQIVECLQIQARAYRKDNEGRELLNNSLRISDVANEGYLRTDATYNRSPNSKGTGIGAEQQTSESGLGAQPLLPPPKFNQGFRSDKSVAEMYQGSLYLKGLSYRNQDLTIDQALGIVESILTSLDQMICSKTIIFANQEPKRYFDDHYIENFSKILRPPSAAIRSLPRPSSVQSNLSRQGRHHHMMPVTSQLQHAANAIIHSSSLKEATSRQSDSPKYQRQMMEQGVTPMSIQSNLNLISTKSRCTTAHHHKHNDRFKFSTFASANSFYPPTMTTVSRNTAAATKDSFTMRSQQSSGASPNKHQKPQLDRMTRVLIEKDRERTLLIKDYLNKTFDDIGGFNTTSQLYPQGLKKGSSDHTKNMYIRNRPIEQVVKAPQANSDEYQLAVISVSSEIKSRYKELPIRPQSSTMVRANYGTGYIKVNQLKRQNVNLSQTQPIDAQVIPEKRSDATQIEMLQRKQSTSSTRRVIISHNRNASQASQP